MVYVFDSWSLFKRLTKHMALQIARIYSVPSTHSTMKIKQVSVQQQSGNVDSGMFAFAFAVEACFGCKPEKVHFDQRKMRRHLYECLSKGELSRFPTMQSDESFPRPTENTLSLKVYCICKMPAQFDTMMVTCVVSGTYNCSCVDIEKEVPEYWECPKCNAT